MTSLGCNTFHFCKYLEKIILPKEIKTIEEETFKNIDSFKIYYTGTEADAKLMTIKDANTNIANWCFYSKERPTENLEKQWHYDTDGKTPILWSDTAA